jgi:ribonuclease-3
LSSATSDHASLAELVERLGHRFIDGTIVDTAMAHRSWCAENPGHASNERLEFLGDAVLGWITADLAFRRFPGMSEGELTGVRKGVVNTGALAEIATELGLGRHVKLGKGEAAAKGSEKPSILADALEALIGAIYVDGGSTVAYGIVETLIAERLDSTAERLDQLDYKSTLQELVAASNRSAPVYDLSEDGPDHDKRFFAKVIIDGAVLGTGHGRSKRTAEQAAAAVASKALVSLKQMVESGESVTDA